MKKTILILTLLCAATITQAQVGIGTTSPAASAQLDVTSTTKGLLPPRMTSTQRDAIASPVAGLMIWCTETLELQVYNGTRWINSTGSGPSCILIGSDIDGEATGDRSGYSVSLSSDGSTVAIGAYYNDGSASNAGQVRVYENISGTWTQVGSDIDGEAANDQSGKSVSLSSDGSIVAIGAEGNAGNGSYSGHVRIYKNISGTWTQQGSDIDGEAANDESGFVSLSSDGSTVAIGAPNNDGSGSNAGHVRVYENISGTWTQVGSDIDGEAANDRSGESVSLSSDGSVVAIGARYNDGTAFDAGHVRVYENVSGTWTQVGADIDGEAANDYFGSVSLSSDGSTVAIGAYMNDGNGASAGRVRIYKNVSGTWTQLGADIDGEKAGDGMGELGSVSLNSDGSILAIGVSAADNTGVNKGGVYIYQYISGTWTQIRSTIYGEAANDQSGSSVSLSSDGSTVAIGARYNDGTASDAGHVRVYAK